jgi:hypothetical protein
MYPTFSALGIACCVALLYVIAVSGTLLYLKVQYAVLRPIIKINLLRVEDDKVMIENN